jgi:hypothetical protein
MNEVNFTLVLLFLIIIHFVSAVIVCYLISRRIKRLSECNRNKYVLGQVKTLKDHRLLAAILPLIGPIIGFAILNGAVIGVPEKGLKVNSPGGSNSHSDGE